MKYKYNGQWNEMSVKVADTLPIGAIIPFGGSNIPSGWLICDGSEVSRTTYSQLFSTIGTSFGEGNGTTTFNLPNLKGRVPVGEDSSQEEFDNIGKADGEKKHKLTIAEMAKHSHELPNVASDATENQDLAYNWGNEVVRYQSTAKSTLPAGGDQSHNNLQPYIVTNYIIKAKQSIGVVGKVLDEKSDSTKDTYSCDYINKLHTYSTSPVKIGTSDDGKDRYRVVVKGTTPAIESGWEVVTNIGAWKQIKACYGTINNYLPIPCYINSEYNLNFQYNGENGNLFCMAKGYLNVPFELTIEYEI